MEGNRVFAQFSIQHSSVLGNLVKTNVFRQSQRGNNNQ